MWIIYILNIIHPNYVYIQPCVEKKVSLYDKFNFASCELKIT